MKQIRRTEAERIEIAKKIHESKALGVSLLQLSTQLNIPYNTAKYYYKTYYKNAQTGLNTLTARQKAIVELHKDFTAKQIAFVLDISPDYVRKTLKALNLELRTEEAEIIPVNLRILAKKYSYTKNVLKGNTKRPSRAKKTVVMVDGLLKEIRVRKSRKKDATPIDTDKTNAGHLKPTTVSKVYKTLTRDPKDFRRVHMRDSKNTIKEVHISDRRTDEQIRSDWNAEKLARLKN